MDKPLRLPIELILQIISCYIPPGTPDGVFNTSHATTKTLLAFTLVCHETRRTANRLLLKHCVKNCVKLDSPERLSSFLLQIPRCPELKDLIALSLAPFDEDIDDLPRCLWVRELFCFTSETLTKLVIDMPLRTCYPENDHLAVRPVLREGFERLVNLVEFVSTQDELYLDVRVFEHVFVWTKWPKLKRLALYNPALDPDHWRNVALHPSLETIVMCNVDSLEETNPKLEYFKYTNRPLRVILCLSWYWYNTARPFGPHDWQTTDPDQKITIMERYIEKSNEELEYGYEYTGHPLQEYVKSAAEDGSLWSDEGRILTEPSQLLRPRRE